MKKIIVTGGAGFIGSNLLNLLVPKNPDCLFINLDVLTYAANLYSLKDIEVVGIISSRRATYQTWKQSRTCFGNMNPTV